MRKRKGHSVSSEWKAIKNLRSTGWYVECDGVELATANERLANLTSEEAEANARKMAAAPELLAACRDARTALNDAILAGDEDAALLSLSYANLVISVLSAAIAKATGEKA